MGCHLTHLHANHSSIFIPSPPISFTHSNPRPSSSLEPLQSSLEPFSRSSLLAAATLLRSVRTIRGRRERETHRDRETRERTSAFHLFSFVFFSAGSTARGIPLLLRVPLEATAFHLFAFIFFSAGSTGGNWIALPLKAVLNQIRDKWKRQGQMEDRRWTNGSARDKWTNQIIVNQHV
ncbi:hypothetical protein LXL04_018969 [Taraxacum kok-saghyz]